MRIRLFGQRNILGMGVHFSAFATGLRSMRILGTVVEEFDALDTAALAKAHSTSKSSDINIWFFPLPAMSAFAGTRIIWAIFEADVLPDKFIRELSSAHAVWVPSEWGRRVLIDNGLPAGLVDVIPEGVSASAFHPFIRTDVSTAAANFYFLAVGKYEQRKGYEALLEGFRQAFGANPAVRLMIKGDFFLKRDEKKIALEKLVSSMGISNVHLLWGSWSPELVFGLYNKADCFVFPSRAEGWGLPLIEAIASGLPVISTYYSGHTEYLSQIRGGFREIDFDLTPITDPEFLGYWGGQPEGRVPSWAAPSAESVAYHMTRVVENRVAERGRAFENSLKIRSQFDWQVMLDRALASLIRRGLMHPQVGFNGAPFNDI